MKLEEMKLTTELYKHVVLQKIKEDKRYCKAEVLSDCLDAVAYLSAQLGSDDTKEIYQQMLQKYSEIHA